jgi:hypothetical protein
MRVIHYLPPCYHGQPPCEHVSFCPRCGHDLLNIQRGDAMTEDPATATCVVPRPVLWHEDDDE